jgi:hypothetical protein
VKKNNFILSLFFIFYFFIASPAITILPVSDTTEELYHVIKLHQVEQFRREIAKSIQRLSLPFSDNVKK